MATRRFHAEDVSGQTATITGPQAHHAVTVLRLAPGDAVVVFDGQGHEAAGVIRTASPTVLTVEITDRAPPAAGDAGGLTLAVAAPKGNRADWLVEKCAELGVGEIVWLRCRRSEVLPGGGKMTRWRRKAVEAAKQSGSSTVLSLQSVRPLAQFVIDLPAVGSVWYGDPRPDRPTLADALAAGPDDGDAQRAATIIIGPEGGLVPEEQVAIERAGGHPVRLANAVLRIETAAIVAASIWIGWSLSGGLPDRPDDP